MKERLFIIAEAGVNHNGSLQTAKKLIDIAAHAGCNAVKFQTFNAQSLVCCNTPQAAYQARNTQKTESQHAMLSRLALGDAEFTLLFKHCRMRGIEFMSTPFCIKSADFLDHLGMRVFKISSGDITNRPLIEHVASKRKPIILSTGMSYQKEVKDTVGWIKNIWSGSKGKKASLALLHCVSNYPAAIGDINLRAMVTLHDTFGTEVGLSDHTTGIETAIAAVALGACVIEKHFTLRKNMAGPDHKASLEPDELKRMVKALTSVKLALGDGVKKPARAEMAMRKIGRRSIVALQDIRKGERFSEVNLTVKRPGTGLSAARWHNLIGRTATRNYKADKLISAHEMAGGRHA